jgi:hypothetical protein
MALPLALATGSADGERALRTRGENSTDLHGGRCGRRDEITEAVSQDFSNHSATTFVKINRGVSPILDGARDFLGGIISALSGCGPSWEEPFFWPARRYAQTVVPDQLRCLRMLCPDVAEAESKHPRLLP